MGTPSFDPDILVNPAELSSSSTVQGENVANVAVAGYEPTPMDVPEEYSSNHAALIARETIVIDDDDTSNSSPPIQLYQFSIAYNGNDKDNAGVLAIAEMQARFALVGCIGTGIRKQDKILLGELADNISARNHLPESFTLLPDPEDRRPVPSPVEERIESTVMHNTHS
jgi:hypothetical protein